jgi:3-oxoacyl-[acyl-carrier-protein] synthase II
MIPLAIDSLGAVTCLGRDWPTTWHALCSGEFVAQEFRRDASLAATDLVLAGLPSLDRSLGEDGLGPTGRLVREVLDQVAASSQPARIYGGCNHGDIDLLAAYEESAAHQGILFDPIPALCRRHYGGWFYSACTSSMHALAAASLDLQDRECDAAIVVGADALSTIGAAGFWRCRATTAGKCAPFQESRDGLLIGEGAVAIRLKRSHDSNDVFLLGFGTSCDAGHPTDPDPSGAWLEQAIRDALSCACVVPHAVAAVVAHGTGTRKNDSVEAAVYRRVFAGCMPPITSVKGTIGHLMGASGLLNVAVAVEVVRSGRLPPTAGKGTPIDGLDLVFDAGGRALSKAGPVLTIACGFGGNNVAAIVGPRR